MIPSRLKLGFRKRQLNNSKTLKISQQLHHQAIDLQNLQNLSSQFSTLSQSAIIKSTPSIQYDPKNLQSSEIHQNKSKIAYIEQQEMNLKQYQNSLNKRDAQILIKQQNFNHLINQNSLLKAKQQKMQIELSAFNKEYYDKEIKRLKEQNDQYQINEMQLKHKYQLVNNQKDELQILVKNKNQQLKQYLKAIQKEKIISIESRNQKGNNQRVFQQIIVSLEQSNKSLSANFEEVNQKNHRLQSIFSEKMAQVQSLNCQIQSISQRYHDTEQKNSQIKKQYEKILQQRDFKIYCLQNELQDQKRQFNKNMQVLQNQLQNIKRNRISDGFLVNKTVQTTKNNNESIKSQIIISNLEAELKQCHISLIQKQKIITELKQKLLQSYTVEQYAELQKKCQQFEEQKLKQIKKFEERILSLHRENQKLKIEKLINNQKPNSTNSQSFDQIFKKTLTQNELFKSQLTKRSEQCQALRQQLIEFKLQEKKNLNEIQILQKKLQSADKNIKIELEVEKQNYTNQIDSLKRKLSTLQTRFDCKVRQTKQKDTFIQNTLIGRSKSQEIPIIIAELERIFLTIEKTYK